MAVSPDCTGTRAVASACDTAGTMIVIVGVSADDCVCPTVIDDAEVSVSSEGGGLAVKLTQADKGTIASSASEVLKVLGLIWNLIFWACSREASADRSTPRRRPGRTSPRPM